MILAKKVKFLQKFVLFSSKLSNNSFERYL
jgi:hypothetical protein